MDLEFPIPIQLGENPAIFTKLVALHTSIKLLVCHQDGSDPFRLALSDRISDLQKEIRAELNVSDILVLGTIVSPIHCNRC